MRFRRLEVSRAVSFFDLGPRNFRYCAYLSQPREKHDNMLGHDADKTTTKPQHVEILHL